VEAWPWSRGFPRVTATPSIDTLLASARIAALEAISGKPATLQNLATFGAIVRNTILAQAAVGMWVAHGIGDVSQIAGLKVEATLGNRLTGEPAIKLDYDFSQTNLPLLTVKNVSAV
jgi:hypothetical protein